MNCTCANKAFLSKKSCGLSSKGNISDLERADAEFLNSIYN